MKHETPFLLADFTEHRRMLYRLTSSDYYLYGNLFELILSLMSIIHSISALKPKNSAREIPPEKRIKFGKNGLSNINCDSWHTAYWFNFYLKHISRNVGWIPNSFIDTWHMIQVASRLNNSNTWNSFQHWQCCSFHYSEWLKSNLGDFNVDSILYRATHIWGFGYTEMKWPYMMMFCIHLYYHFVLAGNHVKRKMI